MKQTQAVKTVGTLAMISCIAVLSGCATMPGGVAASSTPIDGRAYTNLGSVQEVDSRIYLLGLIPISGENSIRDAIDKAVKRKGGDAMINVTVDAYSQYWILFAKASTRVQGDVIKFQSTQAPAPQTTP